MMPLVSQNKWHPVGRRTPWRASAMQEDLLKVMAGLASKQGKAYSILGKEYLLSAPFNLTSIEILI